MQGEFFGRTRISKSWLFTPPLQGIWAVAVSVVAVALPTVIRLGMSPLIDDEACTIFCPFVLATSILCGWRYALPVAIGSAISCNTILMGPPYTFHFQRSEIEGLGIFLFYSACVILVVRLFRATARRSLRQAGAQERASGIVFSLDEGQAWASWYGIDAPVRLGPQDEVVQ
jgi:K+-sensing histidine kinase KdpD